MLRSLLRVDGVVSIRIHGSEACDSQCARGGLAAIQWLPAGESLSRVALRRPGSLRTSPVSATGISRRPRLREYSVVGRPSVRCSWNSSWRHCAPSRAFACYRVTSRGARRAGAASPAPISSAGFTVVFAADLVFRGGCEPPRVGSGSPARSSPSASPEASPSPAAYMPSAPIFEARSKRRAVVKDAPGGREGAVVASSKAASSARVCWHSTQMQCGRGLARALVYLHSSPRRDRRGLGCALVF